MASAHLPVTAAMVGTAQEDHTWPSPSKQTTPPTCPSALAPLPTTPGASAGRERIVPVEVTTPRPAILVHIAWTMDWLSLRIFVMQVIESQRIL